MIAGHDAPCFGEAKNSWLTGTAAWTFVAALARASSASSPTTTGLRIDPCIPRGWASYRVTRRFRGVVYEISVANPDGVCGGVRSLTVDGRELAGNVVPVVPGRKTVVVGVTLGQPTLARTTTRSRPDGSGTTSPATGSPSTTRETESPAPTRSTSIS